MVDVQCWLEHLDGSRVKITEFGVILGQGPSCVFPVMDAQVLPRHAQINVNANEVFLTPSEGGVCRINGQQVEHPRLLKNGDWISLVPGQLFRFSICGSRMDETPWVLRLVDQTIRLPRQQKRSLSDVELHHDDGGRLCMRVRQAVRYKGRAIQPDSRTWCLSDGEHVQLGNGQYLEVVSGPSHSVSPRSWFAADRLWHHPPTAHASLSEDGWLTLGDAEHRMSADVGDAAPLLWKLLQAGGQWVALLPDEQSQLRALQERMVSGGMDGFALIQRQDRQARMPLGANVVPNRSGPPPMVQRMQSCWWLYSDDGSHWRIGDQGILIGRHEACEIRCDVPYVHRYHALLSLHGEGLKLSPLGRNPTYVNVTPISAPQELQDGDEIRVVTEKRFWVVRRPGMARRAAPYRLQLPNGECVTVNQEHAYIGGRAFHDVPLAQWEKGVCLLRVGDGLYVRSNGDVSVDGEAVPARQTRAVSVGSVIAQGDQSVSVVSIESAGQTPVPAQLSTQAFARVGRLMVRLSDNSVRQTCLSGPSFGLLQVLLEAAVGSRLRGLIQTCYGDEEAEMDALPAGAMRLRDLRMELSTERRLSMTATRLLLSELQAVLLSCGLEGTRMIEVGGSWARLTVPLECTVQLYR